MVLEESSLLTPADLPMAVRQSEGGNGRLIPPRVEIPDEGLSLEENEKMLVMRALEKTGGNQTQTARLLRITRDTLRYKIKKYNLK